MLKHRLVLVASLLPLCFACSGLQTRETPKGLSPNTIECSKKPDAQLCWRAFEQAAHLRDRSSAGQALMMFAQTQPKVRASLSEGSRKPMRRFAQASLKVP